MSTKRSNDGQGDYSSKKMRPQSRNMMPSQPFMPPMMGGSGFGSNNKDFGAPIDPQSYSMMMRNMPVHRCVYLGNLPADSTEKEVIAVVRGGIVENVRVMPEKHCAFVSFVSPEAAKLFFNYAMEANLKIGDRPLKVNWASNPTPISQEVLHAVLEDNATRNVFVGTVTPEMTEEFLTETFKKFGHIESIRLVTEKNCAFVSFTKISAAMRAVKEMKNDPVFQKHRVNYARDICSKLPPRTNLSAPGPSMNDMRARPMDMMGGMPRPMGRPAPAMMGNPMIPPTGMPPMTGMPPGMNAGAMMNSMGGMPSAMPTLASTMPGGGGGGGVRMPNVRAPSSSSGGRSNARPSGGSSSGRPAFQNLAPGGRPQYDPSTAFFDPYGMGKQFEQPSFDGNFYQATAAVPTTGYYAAPAGQDFTQAYSQPYNPQNTFGGQPWY